MIKEHLAKNVNMLTCFLLPLILLAEKVSNDPLQEFQKKLAVNIHIHMMPPPNFNPSGTCYHYTELMKVEIDKNSRIVSITYSDSAPDWLKQDIERLNKQKRIDYKKLNQLSLKAKLRNCFFVFPVRIESDDFPCGQENKKRSLEANFFKFNGKDLKGNIIFGDPVTFNWSVDYRY